ncbi:MAG: hypothetical protein K9N23_08545 [Akkermansiaceae bacterium]|nr:hypothetical protein [Akkermansiaceae bacterium]
MIYLAWFVAIFSVLKFGEYVYGVVTYAISVSIPLVGIFPRYSDKRQLVFVGFLNGVIGTQALYYLLNWSLAVVLANYPKFSKCNVVAFVLIVIFRIWIARTKTRLLKEYYASRPSREAVLASFQIVAYRWAMYGTITSVSVMAIIALIQSFVS